ncbi:MAG: hypothetical protein QME58_08360 [Bacteroidota bacterium]|nr:hypothetical protein [Bacteroidota bacterium]
MEINNKIYCIGESVYSNHITKRNCYTIFESKENTYRIKNDSNKLVWIPKTCFVDHEIPAIVSINVDDEIKNPNNDCVEVTIEFSDGKKYWTTFVTVEYLENLMKSRNYLVLNEFIIINEISEIDIHTVIQEMDRTNELNTVLKSY